MKYKVLSLALALVLASTALSACAPAVSRETLTQVSTIDALMNGVYDGMTTVDELKKYGDFGIGTFAGLDGEMILLDGVYYQVKADGIAYTVKDSVGTPFAAVTFFDSDVEAQLDRDASYLQVQEYLDSILPTDNIFYAIRISGTFSIMQTRTVPAQQKPYLPLAEVIRNQTVFELKNIEGTIVGFRCPSYVNGINVPGYHLHFLSADNKAGGHVLDFKVIQATASVDNASEFNLILPGPDSDFYQLDLTPDISDDLDKVEK